MCVQARAQTSPWGAAGQVAPRRPHWGAASPPHSHPRAQQRGVQHGPQAGGTSCFCHTWGHLERQVGSALWAQCCAEGALLITGS